MNYVPVRLLDEDEYEANVLIPTSHSRSLYVSHFISTWNSRGFEFGAILFLADIYTGTLLPMSIYALFRAFAAITFSPVVGRYIDTQERLPLVRQSIMGQRIAVTLSCIGFWVLLVYKSHLNSLIVMALFGGLSFLGCVEKLSIIANTIAVERDWVIVIAGNDGTALQNMNSQMRRIDLFCKLVSPLAIALLNSASPVIAVLATLLINLASFIAEYLLIAFVYRRTPDLAISSRVESRTSPTFMDLPRTSQWSCSQLFRSARAQVAVYCTSPALLPSLSLSLLYLTVLSFSGQMVTFLLATRHPKLNSSHIGIMRTVATCLEISATFVAPLLIKKIGPVRAGIWSLSWQFLCLTPGVVTLWTPIGSQIASTFILVVAVILSRIGLWCFDLVAQLQVQNSIDATRRGSFSATESSLQNFFELCAFATTVVWSEPEQFRYPAAISIIAVYVAAACYARFVRIERGHLLHMPPCCETWHNPKANRDDEDHEELATRQSL